MPTVPVAQNRVGIASVDGTKLVPGDLTGTGLQAAGAAAGAVSKGIAEVRDVAQENAIHLDHAGAKTLDNGYVTDAQQIRSNFLSTQGLNAGVQKPSVDKALVALRDKYVSQATTPLMKRMVSEVIDERQAGLQGEFQTHYLTETSHAENTASMARQQIAGNEAVATTDAATRQLNIDTGRTEIASRNARLGLDSSVTTADQFSFESGIHADIARAKINANDIDGAIAYRDANKAKLTAKDDEAITLALKSPLERRDTNAYVDRHMGIATQEGGATFAYGDPLHGAGRTPVPGGQFNAKRDYGGHQGVDIPAPLGTPIYATGPGTATISHSALGGTIVTVDHGNGMVSKYDHLGKVNIEDGQQVTPDTVLGSVGVTGRTTGPHLHFEVRQNGKPLDPDTVIGQTRQSPTRHDLNSLLAVVDADLSAGKITPEDADRYKTEIERRVGRDDQLEKRGYEDAQRKALDAITGLGANGFTSMSQIPADTRAGLSSEDRLRFMDMAASNAKSLLTGEKVKADGPDAYNLHRMAQYDPEGFKALNLGMYQTRVTPSELEALGQLQGELRTKEPTSVDHGKIWSAIDRGAPDLGLDLGTSQGKPRKPEDRAKAMQIFNMVHADLAAQFTGKGQPSDDQVQKAYANAVRNVMVRNPGESPRQMHAFEVGGPAAPVPTSVRQRIVATYPRFHGGTQPTEGQIAEEYNRYRGVPGFWK